MLALSCTSDLTNSDNKNESFNHHTTSILETDSNYVEWNNNGNGLTFSRDDVYVVDGCLERVPLTYEATIKIQDDMAETERAGVIFGNYDGKSAAINFEIYYNGNPRLFFMNSNGEIEDFIFTKVNVCTGERIHLSIVDDPTTRLLNCFVDGILKQSLNNNRYKECPTMNMRIGTDGRETREQFFKGTLYDFAAYSVERNNSLIQADKVGIYKDDPHLLCAYEFTGINNYSTVRGINNKHDLLYNSMWIEDVEIPVAFDYSFAVIGDTQIMTRRWPNDLHCIYDYVIDSTTDEKIAFCIGLGDITDSNSKSEWELAKYQINRMDGVVPYALNIGNHDSSLYFNTFFGGENNYYQSTILESFNNNAIENSCWIINACAQKYLIFALEYGVPDEVIDWASDIINKNPDCRIIVSTHAYLDRRGFLLDKTNSCPPSIKNGLNDGDQIWEKLIKKHNVDLVLCGHDPSDDIVTIKTKNDFGNVVTQMLINPQGIDVIEPTGMVAMLYFSNSGKKIDVRYYSTVKHKYLRECNQFYLRTSEL